MKNDVFLKNYLLNVTPRLLQGNSQCLKNFANNTNTFYKITRLFKSENY